MIGIYFFMFNSIIPDLIYRHCLSPGISSYSSSAKFSLEHSTSHITKKLSQRSPRVHKNESETDDKTPVRPPRRPIADTNALSLSSKSQDSTNMRDSELKIRVLSSSHRETSDVMNHKKNHKSVRKCLDQSFQMAQPQNSEKLKSSHSSSSSSSRSSSPELPPPPYCLLYTSDAADE